MKYIYSTPTSALTTLRSTLAAAGISIAIIVAVNGFRTILDTAFSSVTPLFGSACTRFC